VKKNVEKNFEAYVEQEVVRKAVEHSKAAAEKGREAMGLLAGQVLEWQGEKYLLVQDYLTAGNSATSVSVRFSDEAFPQLATQVNAAKSKGKIIVGWCHCLPPSELIMTSCGPKQANEVYEEFLKKGFVKVPSLDLNKSRLSFSAITKAAKHKSVELVVIKTGLNREITSTPEHKFLALTENGLEWTGSKNIRVGSFLAIPTSIPVEGQDGIKIEPQDILIKRRKSVKYYPKLPTKVTPDLMRFLGLLYSDGHIRPRAWIEFSNTDEKLIQEFSVLVKKLFDLETKIDRKPYGIRARIFSAIMYKYIANTLEYSKKRLPPIVFRCSRKNRLAFINGLSSGDGYSGLVSKKKKERVLCIYLGENRRLSDELVYLFSTLGMKARIRQQKQNFQIRNHDYIYAAIVQENPTQNSDIIPFGGQKIRELCRIKKIKVHPHFALTNHGGASRTTLISCLSKLKKMKVTSPIISDLTTLVNLPIQWVKVNSKQVKRSNIEVFDFFVEGTHTFIAGSGPIISHNSHPSYGCFLSGTDVSTQRKYFCEEFSIAMVVDPVRREKKVFKLEQNGKGYREASYAVIRKRI